MTNEQLLMALIDPQLSPVEILAPKLPGGARQQRRKGSKLRRSAI